MGHNHHSHDHGHAHGHHHHGDSTSSIGVAFFLNLSFAIFEIVGAYFTNSMAILSDAIHDLGDTATLGASWIFERMSKKGRTDELTFGYGRFSILGALVSATILLLGSLFVLVESIPRILHPEPVKETGMILMAIVGVLVNGAAVLRMKGGNKINERVVMLHLLEDALGWIAVLIVSIILFFYDLPVLDPLLSVAITIFVLSRIYPNLKESLRIFLQFAPDGLEPGHIKGKMETVPGVKGIHDVHLWSLEGTYNIFSAHVVIGDDLKISETEGIQKQLEHILHDEGIEHETLQFELESTSCKRCD